MNYKTYLLNEYKKQGKPPQYFEVGKTNFIIPVAYAKRDDFFDDFLAFQDQEYLKYDKYNKRNPDKQIQVREVKLNDDIRFIVPLNMAKRNLSDKEIKNRLIKKAVNRYISAVKKTARLNEENPKEKALVSLSENHFRYCHKEHAKFVAQKIATKLGQALKWSSKQTADVAIGLAGSPVFAVYKLLDKKYHYEDNKFSDFLNKQIAPRLKKALLTTAISTATILGVKNNEKISDYIDDIKTERAEKKQAEKDAQARKIKEQAEKEAFFKKYNTTDEIFYQNYKTAKENEALIVSLIACPEGFEEKAYLCSAKRPTIGYGCTRVVVEGKFDENGFPVTIPVTLGMTTTKEKAYKDVIAHLDKSVYSQFANINKELSPQEIASVCMFIYNTGENAFNKSTLCKAINNDADDETIREAFSLIRSVNGQRNYGLINRHGFEGYIFCCENIDDFIMLKPSIVGSPDIKYYEYGKKDKKNPLMNEDKTFVTRNIEEVQKDTEKFKTDNFNKSIIYMLPDEQAKMVLEQFGYSVDEHGKLKKDISWERAQEIASKSSKRDKKSSKKNAKKIGSKELKEIQNKSR